MIKTWFRARLAGCGSDRSRKDYSSLKEKNLLILASKLLDQLIFDLVPELERPLFLYQLSCQLLSRLELSETSPGWDRVANDVMTILVTRCRWDNNLHFSNNRIGALKRVPSLPTLVPKFKKGREREKA